MKYIFLLIIFSFFSIAQDTRMDWQGAIVGPPENAPSEGYGRILSEDDLVYLSELKPFYHGVASGDPTSSSVIIWTRVTTEVDGPVLLNYEVSTDKDMNNIILDGTVTAEPERDYCVKIDLQGLDAGTTYYFQFEYDGMKSIIGRTRTASAPGSKEHLRFAVISCVNYQWGFFNALERIADRDDLDAVIHMGDYIYEYASTGYSHPDFVEFFPHVPDKETIEIADYRLRYSQYRLDPMMIRMHQQHPMIAVWDDHESTNDSYRDGAQNHQENEGDWGERVNVATQVYEEWMPIRIPNQSDKREIYRQIKYGDMLDLYMLELRLTGKDLPMGSKAAGLPATELSPEEMLELANPDRKIMDDKQFGWLLNGLSTSTAQWKLMGSSVMMVPFPAFFNPDAWDGYYVQRETLFGQLLGAGVSNVGTISGDFHMSFASNLVTNSYTNPADAQLVGFEFTTPSVSSANLNEQSVLPVTDPSTGETTIINPLEMNLPERSDIAIAIEQGAVAGQPWFHYANSDQHGYIVVDITEEKIQCDFFHVGDVRTKTDIEIHSASAVVQNGSPLVSMLNINETGPATGKANPPELAPFPEILTIEDDGVLAMGVFPNPADHTTQISFAVNNPQNVIVSLIDFNGNEIAIIANDYFDKGVNAIPINISSFGNGTYLVKIQTKNGSKVIPLKISK